MAAWRIAVLGFRTDSLELERAQLEGHEVEWRFSLAGDPPEVLEHAADADAILAGSLCRIDRQVVEGLRRCRIIARYGIGVDNIDVEAATRRGIWVTSVPDYCIEEVATHTLALLLALHRKLVLGMRLAARSWGVAELRPIPDLASQVLGVVGFGKIGRAVARKAQALGMTVLAYDPFVPAERIAAEGARAAGFEELLAGSDFVSLHLPLTPATRHLIDARALARMKPGAFLINTARGGLVDEQALQQALERGHLAGAALDVLEVEPPPPDHPLLTHPKVLVTPHVAWYSERAFREMRVRAAAEVRRVLEGKAPLHPVNRPVGEAAALRQAGPEPATPEGKEARP